jgi:hypothetical protein
VTLERELLLAKGFPPTLDDVGDTFARFLHFPDPLPLRVTLAAELANRMDGDPFWLAILGGSSRGKTELLLALDGLDSTRVLGSLTEAALLSGTPRKERAKDAKGGILRELPNHGGVLIVKDFGAILSMQRDQRARVLQALRDIYDGVYVRDVGADGATHLEWRGRLGLIIGATGALDRHHSVIAQLGERWLTIRLGDQAEAEMVRSSLQQPSTVQMRKEITQVVTSYLGDLAAPAFHPFTPEGEEFVVALARLTARARSPVERDRYSREIELVPQTEGPPRIARQLHKLAVCLHAMGLTTNEIVGAMRRVAFDSIPSPRREALELVVSRRGEPITTSDAALLLRLPRTTTGRALEDLAALWLLERGKADQRDNSANTWRALPDTLQLDRVIDGCVDELFPDDPPNAHGYAEMA